jgi:hypothetical protein
LWDSLCLCRAPSILLIADEKMELCIGCFYLKESGQIWTYFCLCTYYLAFQYLKWLHSKLIPVVISGVSCVCLETKPPHEYNLRFLWVFPVFRGDSSVFRCEWSGFNGGPWFYWFLFWIRAEEAESGLRWLLIGARIRGLLHEELCSPRWLFSVALWPLPSLVIDKSYVCLMIFTINKYEETVSINAAISPTSPVCDVSNVSWSRLVWFRCLRLKWCRIYEGKTHSFV